MISSLWPGTDEAFLQRWTFQVAQHPRVDLDLQGPAEDATQQAALNQDTKHLSFADAPALTAWLAARQAPTQRLAAVGSLTSGFNHDIGNFLLPIKARLEVLNSLNLPGEVREHLEAISECAVEIQRLMRGMRLLTQDPAAQDPGDTTDLLEWREQALPFYRHALPRQATLRIDIADDLPRAAASPVALSQAVLLMLRDAVPVIEASDAPEVVIRGSLAADGKSIRIALELEGAHDRNPIRSIALPSVERSSHGALESSCGDQAVAVSVDDVRTAAMLVSILNTLGCQARRTERLEPGEAAIWITDPADDALPVARDFLNRAPGRTVAVVGEPAASWQDLEPMVVRQPFRPGDVRRLLSDAQAAREQRRD